MVQKTSARVQLEVNVLTLGAGPARALEKRSRRAESSGPGTAPVGASVATTEVAIPQRMASREYLNCMTS